MTTHNPSDTTPAPRSPYVPPPRVLDAERFWPFMRCKNLVRILRLRSPPRSHHALIERIAGHYRLTPEQLKKTNPRDLMDADTFRRLVGPYTYRYYD